MISCIFRAFVQWFGGGGARGVGRAVGEGY
jgi:hypothetical protein